MADLTGDIARLGMSRRRILQAALLAGPGAMALAACARADSSTPTGTAASGAATLQIASPTNPVKWPINPGNEAIASGLSPEKDAVLRLYNYADYLDPGIIKSFEEKYADTGVKVELSTFNDTLEAMAKIRGGSVPFDIYFPSYDQIGKLVLANLVRPLQHSYIPNIANVYPEFLNPFYDLEWQYTTPYTLYTTGIGWRTDRVSEDIAARPNPYDVFWDPQYQEHLAVLDDYREVIGMTLLRNGGTDVNTGDDALLAAVRDALLQMNEKTQPRVTITGYTDLPEGRLDLSQAWSGDLIMAVSYLPEGTDPAILRYWFPKDGAGVVNNDVMVSLKGGQNPVLSQLFMNHVMDAKQAMNNFAYTGYQPPQVSITPEQLISDGFIPPNLQEAIVLPGYFDSGYRLLELPPDTEAKYLAIWQQFKAGA
ncbi:MAG: spermidine/putrescine ABC transporter substrate-binding protein [Actinobacteria bacterium]|nr:spermidine/putrescine ABC transporter substrate-binding protein [Actinomycetota bacterium]